MNLSEFQTNLIPYPKMKFLLASYSPLSPGEMANSSEKSAEDITSAAFEKGNMMAKCDPRRGKYMTCAVMYRGDITPKDVVSSITKIKRDKTVRFVDWCPTGFKVSISPEVSKI